jgi:hypothetical protein
MFRIYYHLYLGPSWPAIWAIHRPLLEEFASSGLLEKLVICVCGALDQPLALGSIQQAEIRPVSAVLAQTNEFHTLSQLHRDANDSAGTFQYCGYLHSKGSSSPVLSAAGREWSTFLATALLQSLKHLPALAGRGFNCLGSNLALGVFHDFEPPQLHYSGNFWCAKRSVVASARPIELGSRHAAIRHNAECWLATAAALTPFNVISTGVDHYASATGTMDWERIRSHLSAVDFCGQSAESCVTKIDFLRRMIERSTGKAAVRRLASNCLLKVLPYHRWLRWLSVHDLAMRALGSRKSVYFYCPESR